MNKSGSLILVATPIGNLGDISARALDTLRAADVIYCEDTRHSRQLLSHFEILGRMLTSLHEHNEAGRTQEVIGHLEQGDTVALISDAGMPVISDPGQRLVAAVLEAGYQVTAVPGPSAVLTALAVSGLRAERFVFEGFLPSSGKARKERLAELLGEIRTIVLYESPHRLDKTVVDLASILNSDRKIVITRELTKLHEEIWRGNLVEAVDYLQSTKPRGEYTLVIEALHRVTATIEDTEIIRKLRERMVAGDSRRTAVDTVSAKLAVQRKRIYELSLTI